MNNFDKGLKKILKDNFNQVKLQDFQRKQLKAAMKEAHNFGKLSLIKKLGLSVRHFMETTFEIELTPIITGCAIIAVLLIVPILDMKPKTPQQNKYYQQTIIRPDGGMQLVYIPLEERGIQHENSRQR